MADGAAHEDLENGIVLLRAHAVRAGAVCPEPGRLVKGLRKLLADKVDVAGRDVAFDQARRCVGCRGRTGIVLLTERARVGGVV